MTIVEPTTDTEIGAEVAAEPAPTPEAASKVEVLVEEISIDGMCGAY